MEIIPLRDYVLLEEVKAASKFETLGIVLPEDVDMESTKQATIIRVGSEVKHPDLVTGTVVMFKAHMFDDVLEDKKLLKIGQEENIYAIVK